MIKKVNLGQKKIISVGKTAIKIGNTRKFVSIIPTIQHFLLNMFYCKDDEDDEKIETLKHHINECVNSYTTYILVDIVSNGE